MADSPSDRKCFKIGKDLYRMDQEISNTGREEGYDGTGPYWVLGHVQILTGSLSFLVDEIEVKAPGSSFVMVMPQNSIVSIVARAISTINRAVFSRKVLCNDLPTQATAFATSSDVNLASLRDVEDVLKKGKNPVNICRTSSPHPISLKIKDYLGEHFENDISLTKLASIGKITPEALSRIFKKDWGKSPIQFRNWLRVMESFRHISEEKAIIDTAYDVGFNDLSRFHKQFKSTVGHTPLSIRTRSKNAKI